MLVEARLALERNEQATDPHNTHEANCTALGKIIIIEGLVLYKPVFGD